MRAIECQGRYPVAALQNMMLRVREVKRDQPSVVKRFIVKNTMIYLSRMGRLPNSALHRDLAATPAAVRDSLTIGESIFSADLQLSACGPFRPEPGRRPDALSIEREHL
jgi:hypothetical protein